MIAKKLEEEEQAKAEKEAEGKEKEREYGTVVIGPGAKVLMEKRPVG